MTSSTPLHSIYRWFTGSLPAFLEPTAKRRMSDLPLHLVDDVRSDGPVTRISHNDNVPVRPTRTWQVK